MTAQFGLFAELERQLREALNAPVEEVVVMTKTQRRKIAKLGHRFRKAKPIAQPDKTIVRLNCKPRRGFAVVLEFSYYTPFIEVALKQAHLEIQMSGVEYEWITVLNNEKVT